MIWLFQGSLSLLKTFSAVKQGLKKLRECWNFFDSAESLMAEEGGGPEMPIIGQLDNGTLARMRQEIYNDDDEL